MIKSVKKKIKFSYNMISHKVRKFYFGANEVVIYNFFLALITIDTNINQFIKVYHIFYKIQYKC